MPVDRTRAEVVFLAAAEIADPTARRQYLADTCAGDAELQARVEVLLKAHDRPDRLLVHPAVSAEAATMAFLPEGSDKHPDDTQTVGANPDESLDEALGFLSPPERPDSLGRIGRYDVLEVLGQGGFGIVFRAFDEVLERVVAVKVLAPSMATTSPARKRFLREARSSAAVRHENVVQVHAVEEVPLPHLVMEFVPGETLQQRLDRTGPLDLSDVLRIGRQIAEGLAAAHATGLIHRDIKPSNILIDAGPRAVVKITDFGLARAADDASLTRSGVVSGTPMYMAPEQAKGESLDHRADLFSLGSVLYVTCTGRPPFRANSTLAVLKRVAEDTPRPIREIIPEVPAWLCRIIEKLHAKEPAGRYGTSREVADALADCEAQVKAHGGLRDFSRIPGGRPTRRRAWKWIAALAILPLLLLFGWLVFGYYFRGDPTTGRLVVEVREPGLRLEIFATGKPHTKRVLPPDGASGVRIDETLPLDHWNVVAYRGSADGPYHAKFDLRPEGHTVVVPAFEGPPSVHMPPLPGGWASLFNGKDLTGWTGTREGAWVVRDGVLVGESAGVAYLRTVRADYANFHLRAEVRVSRFANSGVYFRWNERGLYEANANVGALQPDRTGSLNLQAPLGKWTTLGFVTQSPVPADTWFTLEVEAVGPALTVKVNGLTTATARDETLTQGQIGLELLGGGGRADFRKIEVRELPPPAVSPPVEK